MSLLLLNDGELTARPPAAARTGPPPTGSTLTRPPRNTTPAAVTGTNPVAVLDARTGAPLVTIAVAAGPAGMTIDHRTGRVFVGNQAAGVITTLEPAR